MTAPGLENPAFGNPAERFSCFGPGGRRACPGRSRLKAAAHVSKHVKRARAAYDTVSRTQLVVYGLRDAWISFEDAIPPDG